MNKRAITLKKNPVLKDFDVTKLRIKRTMQPTNKIFSLFTLNYLFTYQYYKKLNCIFVN
jgi:hypothetical protein